MKFVIGAMPALAMLAGCSVIRSLDDSVAGTLEAIPVMKMIGIESRHSQEQRESASSQHETGPGAKVTLWLKASAWVNPSPMQTPSPVRVWVYELESIDKFSSADLMHLQLDPQKALGPDLRRVRDTVLAPDEEISLNWWMSQPGYIGIVADFRKPADQTAQSRQMIAFDGKTPSSWQVRLSGNSVVTLANVTSKRPLSMLDDESRLLPGRTAAKPAPQKTKK